ncbi:MAG: RNB domain-containing ribonuclease [Chitinophagaceae bacterium]|nr:RNB domain-containing ribonuclease [Rubrivivax sp.]
MDAPDLTQIAALEMRTNGFEPVFAPEVLREAEGWARDGPARPTDIRDLRSCQWFSIDNVDTLDLDQVSWAEALPDGSVRLAVAVADVDAMVHRGSSVDAHAAANTTSVYTAAGVFPMLPPLLSNDRTSLHEGEDRLSVVVEMKLDREGSVTDSHLYRAAVRNHAKLDYDSVAAWLEEQAPAPAAIATNAGLQAQLRLHDHVARNMRQWRQRRGALNVATSQVRPVFDKGELVDLRADERNRAKDLIADIMIATNGATARFLAHHGQPSLRRVLQQPRRWDRLVQLAEQHGAELPPAPDALALDRFLTARRTVDPSGFEDLSLAVVKLLGSGAYAAAAGGAAPAGHFGLAVNDYAHSTAPNRRFVDLVTQRLLKATLAQQAMPYSMHELDAIAKHCTVQEDSASTVERRVLKAAAAHLLQGRIGERFDAIITGVVPKGTFVRITSPMVEGQMVRGFEGLDVGDTVGVRLRGVDIGQRFIDFERV